MIMRGGNYFFCLLLAIYQMYIIVPTAHATVSSNVVIAQMYPGATGVATQEFIELYNTADTAVDITGWCVSYVPSSGSNPSKLGCITAPDASTHLWLKAGGYATFISNEYKTAHGGTADVVFSSGISATAGHIRLTDAGGAEIDRLGWGSATNPETTAVAAPANGKSLQRKTATVGYQDTDDNSFDFQAATPSLHASDVYEVVIIIDVCPNIAEIQSIMPSGYLADTSGDCQVDSCLNIAGLQISVPDQYDADTNGICTAHDECDNISGVQSVIPQNMIRTGLNDCAWDVVPLVLSELLPNAVGSDTGNEFIEIYNPTDRTIDLSLYSVKVGVGGEKTYAFPIGATIAPGEYRTFNDSVMKFTLVNTYSRVVLTAIDGTLLGDSGLYDSPQEGYSWSFIDGGWHFTNRPTPGSENLASLPTADKMSDETDVKTSPCPVGKYRNPLTNRCRTIVADASLLAPCNADQYRNPETGRCKKITAALAPCKEGQYRSEETNRCRNIVLAAMRKPCKDSQYRSEETGRCRNVTSMPSANFAVEPIKDTGMVFAGWWAVGGVLLLAVGYAVWEWRSEILAWLRLMKR